VTEGAEPPSWSATELAQLRLDAIESFVRWWGTEAKAAYQEYFRTALATVDALLSLTDDLRTFGPEVLQNDDPKLREAARYLAGPPLSEDDLKILTGASRLWLPGNLTSVVSVILQALDAERFPWLTEPQRTPTSAERERARLWTAGLLAAQKAATGRRSHLSRKQERAIDDVLQGPLRFTKVSPRTISSVRDLEPGEYCRQSLVGGTRADLSVGLRDRLLVIECKVSNSEVNSYKRLNHEVGDKATKWKLAFGNQAVPAAVLSGAYSLANLESAQRTGITLFWEHDLASFVDFVSRTR